MNYSKYALVRVTIIRITQETQYPKWAECRLKDAYGREHIFVDKLPIFTEHDVDVSEVPTEGVIRCYVEKEKDNKLHQKGIVRICTLEPDDLESKDGLWEFYLYKTQIIQ
ncbi:MAG: hypothetical protein K2I10_12100 [Lachnospiraceae bacterium]|nr:hypothetical protein [Lachnospiraceae bacterium]